MTTSLNSRTTLTGLAGLTGRDRLPEPWTSASDPAAKADGHIICPHRPRCPVATACDRTAARVVAFHPEQGWSLLCNGVVVFDDTGELLPDGHVVDHRADLLA